MNGYLAATFAVVGVGVICVALVWFDDWWTNR